MNYELTDEQELLRRTVRDFAVLGGHSA